MSAPAAGGGERLGEPFAAMDGHYGTILKPVPDSGDGGPARGNAPRGFLIHALVRAVSEPRLRRAARAGRPDLDPRDLPRCDRGTQPNADARRKRQRRWAATPRAPRKVAATCRVATSAPSG